MVIDGDTNTLNALIENFINSSELPYEFSIEYELENNVLFVDLDLPEIENFNNQYPAYLQAGNYYKNKNQITIKQQYSQAIFLWRFTWLLIFQPDTFIECIVLSVAKKKQRWRFD